MASLDLEQIYSIQENVFALEAQRILAGDEITGDGSHPRLAPAGASDHIAILRSCQSA
jgi:hypothetical protein